MINVSIPFDIIVRYKKLDYMKLHHASNHAIMLSDWCKDQGLIMGLDFIWAVLKDDDKITFTFMNNGEKYSTMFALRFGGGNA